MHARAGQHRTHGQIAVDGVEVQLVANPTGLVTLAVALGADIADVREVGEIFGERAVQLQLESFRRRSRTLLAFFRPTARIRRRSADRFARRALRGLDRRRIAADMTGKFRAGVGLDQVLVDLLRQAVCSKSGKRTTESRFARHLAHPQRRRNVGRLRKASSNPAVVGN